MTRPEFFALEAGEYLERIALLARRPEPERDSLRRLARALRGSALMAGPPGYAVAAGAIEDIARRYHEGGIRWTPWLAGRLAAATSQCQALLRRVNEWSVAEIDLCRRIAEALQLEDPGEEIVSIDSLAPDDEIVAIETLAPDRAPEPIVPIESLFYPADEAIVPIESLRYPEDEIIVSIESLLLPLEAEAAVPIEALAPDQSAFEQSFTTFFRLVHGRGRDQAPVPIQRLLYRGRRALERADVLRQELASRRTARVAAPVLEPLLDELLDLVPLALEPD
jgi:hypothetical protein